MKKLLFAAKSFIIGGVKSIPVVGNMVTEYKANLQESESGQGNINWYRLSGFLLGGIVIWGVLTGKINMEDAGKLFGFIGDLAKSILP